MVLRYSACCISVTLLAIGVRPLEARVVPRFVAGSKSWGRPLEATTAAREQDRLALRRRATALRLGEGGKSCLVPTRICRRGAWGLRTVCRLRGGAVSSGDSEEDFDALDDEDEDDFDDGMMAEEDFGEANFVDRLKQDWKKTPVITRTFFQVSIGVAVLMAFFNRNQWPQVLLLDWEPTILKLQLWRLFTPFFYLGPLGLNFLLTAHFSWTYMSQLEKLHYREPHTFVMLLIFGMSSLLLLTVATGGDVNASYTLGHSLSCFLVMVWSRKFAGTKVNVLEMFELPTELLPYFFVAQTLMMEGVVPWVDLSGLLIGYAWQTLSLKGLLKAPKPLVRLFRNNAFLRAEYARAGKEYGQEMPLHDDDDDDAVQPPEVSDEEEEDETSEGEATPAVESEGKTVKGRPRVVADATSSSARERGAGVGRGGKGTAAEPPTEEEEEEEEEGSDESQEESLTDEGETEETGEGEEEEESDWGQEESLTDGGGEETDDGGGEGSDEGQEESLTDAGEEEETETTDGTAARESEYDDDKKGEYNTNDEEETDSGEALSEETDGEGSASLFEDSGDLEEFDEELETMLEEFEDELDGEFSGAFEGELLGSFEGELSGSFEGELSGSVDGSEEEEDSYDD